MDTQGGKQMEEGPEKRNGWEKVKEMGECGMPKWSPAKEKPSIMQKTTYNRHQTHLECVWRCIKGLGGVMMETTEECNADEKTSNECGGGDGGMWSAEEGTGDTGGGGEASDGSFCV